MAKTLRDAFMEAFGPNLSYEQHEMLSEVEKQHVQNQMNGLANMASVGGGLGSLGNGFTHPGGVYTGTSTTTQNPFGNYHNMGQNINIHTPRNPDRRAWALEFMKTLIQSNPDIGYSVAAIQAVNYADALNNALDNMPEHELGKDYPTEVPKPEAEEKAATKLVNVPPPPPWWIAQNGSVG